MMPPGFALMPGAVPLAADEPLVMDEDAFRAFYDRTARQAWALLYRHTRDMALADDLLQEAYYRLLRTRTRFQSEDHRVHYLFRIAANLATDARRRRGPERVPLGDDDLDALPSNDAGPGPEQRADLARALATLAPRDRDLLWLAYAVGESHAEIGARLGVGGPSIKVLLFRARRRLAAQLRRAVSSFQGGDR
jgi:RNA polymerase sigma-70 factor, ECF subfamily